MSSLLNIITSVDGSKTASFTTLQLLHKEIKLLASGKIDYTFELLDPKSYEPYPANFDSLLDVNYIPTTKGILIYQPDNNDQFRFISKEDRTKMKYDGDDLYKGMSGTKLGMIKVDSVKPLLDNLCTAVSELLTHVISTSLQTTPEITALHNSYLMCKKISGLNEIAQFMAVCHYLILKDTPTSYIATLSGFRNPTYSALVLFGFVSAAGKDIYKRMTAAKNSTIKEINFNDVAGFQIANSIRFGLTNQHSNVMNGAILKARPERIGDKAVDKLEINSDQIQNLWIQDV